MEYLKMLLKWKLVLQAKEICIQYDISGSMKMIAEVYYPTMEITLLTIKYIQFWRTEIQEMDSTYRTSLSTKTFTHFQINFLITINKRFKLKGKYQGCLSLTKISPLLSMAKNCRILLIKPKINNLCSFNLIESIKLINKYTHLQNKISNKQKNITHLQVPKKRLIHGIIRKILKLHSPQGPSTPSMSSIFKAGQSGIYQKGSVFYLQGLNSVFGFELSSTMRLFLNQG